MDAANEGEIVQRKIGTAVGLSLLMSGLGHLYCGRLVTGLVWALAAAATLVLLLLALVANVPAMGLLLLGSLIIWTAAAAHAGWDTAKVRHSYRLREYNRPAVYALLFLIGSAGSVTYALWVREKYVEAFVMHGMSMAPTLQPHDRMIVHKRAFADEPVELGDVIAFRPLEAPERTKIRRVIGLPGQTVEVGNGHIMVDGRHLETRAQTPALPEGMLWAQWDGVAPAGPYLAVGDAPPFPATTVPAHHVLVLGDNRMKPEEAVPELVPLLAIKGRVTLVYWPAGDWGRFGPR